MHVDCECKHDTGINRGNGNHLRITQTTPEQHIGKARFQGTTNDDNIVHYTTTLESTNVKVQNIFHVQNNITCSTNYKYRRAVTPLTPETWFVPGIKL